MDKDKPTKRQQEGIAKANADHAKYKADKREACVQKKDLVDGAYYRGQCRNANIARWFAKQDRFTHYREKFGCRFLEDILHPDDDQVYDVFYAYEKVDEPAMYKDRIPTTAIEQHKKRNPEK